MYCADSSYGIYDPMSVSSLDCSACKRVTVLLVFPNLNCGLGNGKVCVSDQWIDKVLASVNSLCIV